MLAATDTLDLTALGRICRAAHVRRLRVFGSVSRGEQRPDSDIDLLVDYEQDFTPSLFKLADLSEQLRPLFGGRDVDLILPADLHWFIRDQLLTSARTIYER